MTDTYVVVAEVSNFTEANRDEKQAILERVEDVVLVDSLVRDDGTATLYFDWRPEPERDAKGNEVGMTWQEAKDSIEQVRSALAGAMLVVLNPLKVELRDVSRKAPAAKATKSTKSTAKTTA